MFQVYLQLGRADVNLRTGSSLSDVVCLRSSFPDGGVHPDVHQAQAEHLESAAGCAAVHEGLLPGVRMFPCHMQLRSIYGVELFEFLTVVFVADYCCLRKAARTWTCSLGSSQRPAPLLPTLSVRASRHQHTAQSRV